MACVSDSSRGGGGKRGDKGTWVRVPQPCLSRTPKKLLLPTLFWPRQESPDPSLEIYFHGRTKAVCPDMEGPGEHPGSAAWLGGGALESPPYSRGGGYAHWCGLPRTLQLWGRQKFTVASATQDSLTLSLCLHFLESPFQHSGPLSATTGRADDRENFCCGFSGRWVVGKGSLE